MWPWPLSNSQGKVATLIRWGGLSLCYQFRIFNDIPCKKYNCIFEFVKVMFKKYVGPFFAGHGPENCIVNDVTITSSLRSIVQVLLGHFTIFQSGWFVPKIMKSCLNLSKLRQKYCRYLFSGHGVCAAQAVLRTRYHRTFFQMAN